MTMPAQTRASVVQELTHGFWRFAALHAVVDLGCADHLKDGPLPVDELAERCGADARALHRLLRVLTGTGLFAMTGPKTYALTETGGVLCADAPDSMRPAVLAGGEPASWMAMQALPSVARTGVATPEQSYSS